MVYWSRIPTLEENKLFSKFEETIDMDNIENFIKILKEDHSKVKTFDRTLQKVKFNYDVLYARMCTLDCLLEFMRIYNQDPAISMGILVNKLDTCYDKMQQLYNFEMSVHSMIDDTNKRINALEEQHPIRTRICKLLDKLLNKSK